MADVDCAGCRHKISEHKSIKYGPTRCTVEGCDCCQGPAQRDDLVDAITNAIEGVIKLRDCLHPGTKFTLDNVRDSLNTILDQSNKDMKICEG